MQNIHIQPIEKITPIDGWEDFLRDGQQFLRVAKAAHKQQSKAFSPDTLYNLVAMAIEKFIMAFLMKNGDLAENHTMTDLARALEQHAGESPLLREKLHFLDSFQEICDLDTAHYKRPDKEQLKTILAIGDEIQDLITPLVTRAHQQPELMRNPG